MSKKEKISTESYFKLIENWKYFCVSIFEKTTKSLMNDPVT